MTQKVQVQVRAEATPNPATMKFVADQILCPETREYVDAPGAMESPLAYKIFGFPWASKVFLGGDFIAVTKQEWVDWDILAEPLKDLIAEHLESGEPVVHSNMAPAGADAGILESDSDDVKVIKTVLYNEIRPAVAMDGGQISFVKFEGGILFLKMQGSCSGCPSSQITLKQGIETRMKEAVPDLTEVRSVD